MFLFPIFLCALCVLRGFLRKSVKMNFDDTYRGVIGCGSTPNPFRFKPNYSEEAPLWRKYFTNIPRADLLPQHFHLHLNDTVRYGIQGFGGPVG